jgi:hypothetical protein
MDAKLPTQQATPSVVSFRYQWHTAYGYTTDIFSWEMLASGRPDASDGGRRNICVWDPTHHNQAIYLIRSYPHSLCCVHAGAPRDEGATKLVDVRLSAGSLLPCLPAAWSHEGRRSSTVARPRRRSSSAARICLGLPLHAASPTSGQRSFGRRPWQTR